MKKTIKVAKKKPDAKPKAPKKEKTGCVRVASFERCVLLFGCGLR